MQVAENNKQSAPSPQPAFMQANAAAAASSAQQRQFTPKHQMDAVVLPSMLEMPGEFRSRETTGPIFTLPKLGNSHAANNGIGNGPFGHIALQGRGGVAGGNGSSRSASCDGGALVSSGAQMPPPPFGTRRTSPAIAACLPPPSAPPHSQTLRTFDERFAACRLHPAFFLPSMSATSSSFHEGPHAVNSGSRAFGAASRPSMPPPPPMFRSESTANSQPHASWHPRPPSDKSAAASATEDVHERRRKLSLRFDDDENDDEDDEDEGELSSNSAGSQGSAGRREFTCEICSKSFSRNYDLKRHKRMHEGLKPFVCECCLRPFSRQDALQRHLRSDYCSPIRKLASFCCKILEELISRSTSLKYARSNSTMAIEGKMAYADAKRSSSSSTAANGSSSGVPAFSVAMMYHPEFLAATSFEY